MPSATVCHSANFSGVINSITFKWRGVGCRYCPNVTTSQIALAAGVGWVFYIVLGRKAGMSWGADAVTLGTAIGALLVVPIGFAHAGTALLSPALLPFALGVAVLSSALPYTLEMIALTRLPSRTFGTLLSLEPALAAAAGAAFLGERLDLLQWLAIAAIVIAAAGTALSLRRAEAAAPPA